MNDIDSSYYNGNLHQGHQMQEFDYDSDSDEPISFFQKILIFFSRPVTQWLIIDMDNKIYALWCFFDLLMCLLSSYYYCFLSTFVEVDHTKLVQGPVWFFEIVFLISLLLKFNLEYKEIDSPVPVRNYGKIAKRYLKDEFFIEALPLVPFPIFIRMQGLEQYLYFIKVIRILKCTRVLDKEKFMILYKRVSKWNVDRIIENDPIQAEDKIDDVIHITIQIMAVKVF
jgi:hypothetical protein